MNGVDYKATSRTWQVEFTKKWYMVLTVDLYNVRCQYLLLKCMELVNLASKNQKESLSNIKDAVNYLKTMDNANESKIVTIGWRFGVGQLLQ